MAYEMVIGMEVHVELKTESKVFCGCSTRFGSGPNTQTCPVCLGLPGSLPVLNKKALEHTIAVGIALDCTISSFSKFDRKNYFYPDLPKNYQISQYDKPFAFEGKLPIVINGKRKDIRIRRAHLEEDTGKLIHLDDGTSGIDYNRSGVPLLEIVTEPDMRSPQEAFEYLTRLKTLLEYLEVSDCNMEEGSMRCEANVSVRKEGEPLREYVEIKNVASISGVKRALEFEFERQVRIYEAGGTIHRETRRWNPEEQKTSPMRSKEAAHDYRYFPEPDLAPTVISREWIEEIRKKLPELPFDKQMRYMKELGLSEYDAGVLTASRDIAEYYEKCIELSTNYKGVCNWLTQDILGYMNEHKIPVRDIKIKPEMLISMMQMIDTGKISGKIGKMLIEEMLANGGEPAKIVEEKGWVQISDESEIDRIVEQVLTANPDQIASYKSGKTKVVGWLVGQIMKESKGKANPQIVNKKLMERLGKM